MIEGEIKCPILRTIGVEIHIKSEAIMEVYCTCRMPEIDVIYGAVQ